MLGKLVITYTNGRGAILTGGVSNDTLTRIKHGANSASGATLCEVLVAGLNCTSVAFVRTCRVSATAP